MITSTSNDNKNDAGADHVLSATLRGRYTSGVKTQSLEFEHPPLVEAIFDLVAENSTDIVEDLISQEIDLFFSELPDFDNGREELRQIGGRINVRGGEEHSIEIEPPRLRGVRRWNSDRSRTVMFGPTLLGLNVLHTSSAPYGHFSDHKATLRRITQLFLAQVEPARIVRTGHRYINQCSVRFDGPVTAASLFSYYPALPSGIAAAHPNVAVQVEREFFNEKKETTVVRVTLARPVISAEEAVYSLDISATCTAMDASVDAIMEWHDYAHQLVTQELIAALTNEARERFKERK